VWFSWFKAERRVGTYYFYVLDPDFGAGFIKICTYFPYPAKVWLNGHEWAKRQADHAGIGYRALANGFAACDEPGALQAICDRFGPRPTCRASSRWQYSRRRWVTMTGLRATGGSCRCAKSRSPAPSSSTTPVGPAGSSRPSCPTTSASAAPPKSAPCSGSTGAVARPPCPSAPGSSSPAPR
jgi:hypothetical protein